MEVPVLWGLMLLAVLPFINATVDNSTITSTNETNANETPTSPRPVRSPQNYYSNNYYSNRLRQPYYRDDSGQDPCFPNPCGSNTQCYVASGRPVCSCLPGYYGDPTNYCQRGECADSNDCPGSRTCRDYRCVDVCAGQCGVNAECYARNHIPVCTCPARYTGDPLVSCRQRDPEELCHPSPCGANTQCKVVNDRPVCTCLPGYFGSPLQGCRHECDSDLDCGPSQACSNFKCTSPCSSGACASTANCEVRNHRAICSCPPGYFGDPFTSCSAECVVHEDCPYNKPMCSASRCVNPCQGQCGQNADCNVRDRTRAICSCPKDMTGDPFVYCRPFEKRDLCEPNPCGINTKCQPGYDQSGKERPVCSCLPGYVGNALSGCQRGECQSDSECRSDQNCINYECKPVCVNQCGVDAICNARNHVAVCTCPPGFTGSALNRCYRDTSSSRSAYSRSRYYY